MPDNCISLQIVADSELIEKTIDLDGWPDEMSFILNLYTEDKVNFAKVIDIEQDVLKKHFIAKPLDPTKVTNIESFYESMLDGYQFHARIDMDRDEFLRKLGNIKVGDKYIVVIQPNNPVGDDTSDEDDDDIDRVVYVTWNLVDLFRA